MEEPKRYKNYSEPVLSVIEADEILKSHAKEIRGFYDQKKTPHFEIAFFVLDKYSDWRRGNPGISFNQYLFVLIKAGKLQGKLSTLKLGYKVTKVFPDLRDPVKRRMLFDSYREIANTKLTQEQMDELRQEAEDNGYRGRKIREIIDARFNNGLQGKNGIVTKRMFCEADPKGEEILWKLINLRFLVDIGLDKVRLVRQSVAATRPAEMQSPNFDEIWVTLENEEVRASKRKHISYRDHDNFIAIVKNSLELWKPVEGDKFILKKLRR